MAEKSETPGTEPEVPQTRAPEPAAEEQPKAAGAAESGDDRAAAGGRAESAAASGTSARSTSRAGQRPRPTKRAAKQPSSSASETKPAAAKKSAPRKAAKKTAAKKAGAKAAAPEPAAERPATPAERPTTSAEPPATPAEQSTMPAEPLTTPTRQLPATAVPGVWLDAAWDALRHPDQPPRRLASLAVAELGPRAAAWAAWLRRTYPDPPTHGIVRLALHDATRTSWGLSLAEAGGPLVTPVRLVGSAWVRATVVLRVAAAYGYDPADEQRADDLIELFDLNPELTGEPVSTSRVTGAAGQLGLVRTVISRLGLRKGVSAGAVRALIAVSEHTDQLTKLAYRAARHYRPGRAASTEASSESTSSRNTL